MNEYCKILIIDDEFIMRQGMKHLIEWEKEGFQIVGEASNGQEGLELIEQLNPHIILADIVMPILDGMEFSKVVQQKYPQIQIIILSSYDNFEYVKSTLLHGAVDYILKPTLNPTELLNVLKKAALRIPGMVLTGSSEINYDKLLERYILGFDTNLDVRLFENYFRESCYRIFGTNLRLLTGQDKGVANKRKELIEGFFAKHQEEFNVIHVTMNREYDLYLINYKLSKDEYLIRNLEQVVGEMARMREKTHFVLLDKFHKIGHFKEIYEKEFLPVVENFFYYEDVPLIQSKDVNQEAKTLRKFDFLLYSSYLNNKQFAEAIQLLKEYIEAAISAKTEVYKLKNLTKNLIYNLVLPLEQLYSSADKIRQDYFYQIDDTFYVTDFVKTFDEFIQSIYNLVQQKQTMQNDRIQEILSYISEHSSEALELTDVAKVFNFNYTYLSTYFNTHIQEGFSDYLNKIRIEKACVMLKQSMYSIAEISENVGYSDQSYFCRVFKKVTGQTPSSYRRKYQFIGGNE